MIEHVHAAFDWYPPAAICGVDEVGRGTLAGPVVAAAVLLDPGLPVQGLADSKALTPWRRLQLDACIRARAAGFALGRAEVAEIDRSNILRATLLAMQRAIEALRPRPLFALIDGNRCPPAPCAADWIIGGDRRTAAIAAASIIAKVARDREMAALDQIHHGYGFAVNKGYATAEHLAALRTWGPSPVHRRSCIPVLAAGQRELFPIEAC